MLMLTVNSLQVENSKIKGQSLVLPIQAVLIMISYMFMAAKMMKMVN
jgi:hypothetical protein